MNLKDTYNKIAEDWHKDHNHDGWWCEGTDKYISFFNKDDLILDAGCGSGVKSKYLSDRGLKIVGIDISEKLLEIAKKEIPQAEFYEMGMEDVSKLKDEFDGIFAQASLLHIAKKDIKEVLRKLNKKLKSGGYFYIAVKENKNIKEEIVKENDYGYEYERFFSYYTLDELKSYLKGLNLKIVFETVADSGKTNWIQVIAQKQEIK